MKKPIANIVFYKFWGEQGEMQQACIFYEDGTVKNVSFEEGLEESYDIIRNENVTSQEEFQNLINKRRIYSITGKEFERRFQEFRGRGITTTPYTAVPTTAVVQENNQPTKVEIVPQTGSELRTPKGKRVSKEEAEQNEIITPNYYAPPETEEDIADTQASETEKPKKGLEAILLTPTITLIISSLVLASAI